MKKIVLAGNAVTAQIVSSYIGSDPRYRIGGYTVDDAFVEGGKVSGQPTVGLSDLESAFPPKLYSVVMAMGYSNVNDDRQRMFERLKKMGYDIETYLHPQAIIHTDLPIGEGSIVLPGAVVEPFVRLGSNSVIWANVTLAHHSVIGDNCWVASGSVISGNAVVGDNCFIGVNATIVNNVTLGDHVIVGGGALITKDAKASSVHIARSAEPFRFTAHEYVKHFGF